jgi:hypothetical protein
MTWKLYALGSFGAFAVTYLVSQTAAFDPGRVELASIPAAASQASEMPDLAAMADELRARVDEATAYRMPSRNAFRFRELPRAEAAPAPVAAAPAPEAAPVQRPPYAMAGLATTIEDGTPQRTAILSSLTGVTFAKEGDVLDGVYRVLSVTDESVELESIADGARATLRLPR